MKGNVRGPCIHACVDGWQRENSFGLGQELCQATTKVLCCSWHSNFFFCVANIVDCLKCLQSFIMIWHAHYFAFFFPQLSWHWFFFPQLPQILFPRETLQALEHARGAPHAIDALVSTPVRFGRIGDSLVVRFWQNRGSTRVVVVVMVEAAGGDGEHGSAWFGVVWTW